MQFANCPNVSLKKTLRRAIGGPSLIARRKTGVYRAVPFAPEGAWILVR